MDAGEDGEEGYDGVRGREVEAEAGDDMCFNVRHFPIGQMREAIKPM